VPGCAAALGNAKIDNAGSGLPSIFRHQDVGRLQVAMDDGLLMGVLHAFANPNE